MMLRIDNYRQVCWPWECLVAVCLYFLLNLIFGCFFIVSSHCTSIRLSWPSTELGLWFLFFLAGWELSWLLFFFFFWGPRGPSLESSIPSATIFLLVAPRQPGCRCPCRRASDHPDGPVFCKWSSGWAGLLQMIFRMGCPYANVHSDEPAFCKWSSRWAGPLQMIIQMGLPSTNGHPNGPASCK